MPEPSDLQEQLPILAELQQPSVDMASGEVQQERAKSKWKELKGQIAVQRNKVQELVPATLWPLFSRKAAACDNAASSISARVDSSKTPMRGEGAGGRCKRNKEGRGRGRRAGAKPHVRP